MKNSPIIPVSITIMIVSFAFIVMTIVIQMRIVGAMWISLSILERIGMDKVGERVDALKNYREKHLSDLAAKSKMGNSVMNTQVVTIQKDTNGEGDMPSMDLMESTSRDLQTPRDLQRVPSELKPPSDTQPLKPKRAADKRPAVSRLRIKKTQYWKVILPTFLRVVPIVLLGVALVIVQL